MGNFFVVFSLASSRDGSVQEVMELGYQRLSGSTDATGSDGGQYQKDTGDTTLSQVCERQVRLYHTISRQVYGSARSIESQV